MYVLSPSPIFTIWCRWLNSSFFKHIIWNFSHVRFNFFYFIRTNFIYWLLILSCRLEVALTIRYAGIRMCWSSIITEHRTEQNLIFLVLTSLTPPIQATWYFKLIGNTIFIAKAQINSSSNYQWFSVWKMVIIKVTVIIINIESLKLIIVNKLF